MSELPDIGQTILCYTLGLTRGRER